MQFIRVGLSVCLLWLTLPVGAAKVLTEDSVEALFDRVMTAYDRRDFDRLFTYYSEDATFVRERSDREREGEIISKTVTVEDLREEVKRMLKFRFKERYEISNMDIVLAPDKKSAEVHFSMRSWAKGTIQMIEVITTDEVHIGLINGKPKVTGGRSRVISIEKKGS